MAGTGNTTPPRKTATKSGAREPQKKKKLSPRARRARRIRWICILSIVLVVLVIVTLVIVGVIAGSGQSSVFGIREIVTEGNSHYTSAQLIEASGLQVGQSVWSVNKKAAAENIQNRCPYVESVEVSSASFDVIRITITETTAIGVMESEGQWQVVGATGRVVEVLPAAQTPPEGYLYLKGATATGEGLGGQAMDERSFSIVCTLLDAFSQYGLQGIVELDLTDKTNLTMDWKGQVTILLGNDSNLTHEIGVVANVLPQLLEQHGEQIRGQLNVSSYSIEGARQQAIFTPSALLPSTTTSPTEATAPTA